MYVPCHIWIAFYRNLNLKLKTSEVNNDLSKHLPVQSINSNTRARCELCSELTSKTPERRYCCRSGVSVVNFEHISHLVLAFLFLTLNM